MSKKGGSITVIVGPMFSGKTSTLFRYADRHILANERVLMLKYASDTRYTPENGRNTLAASHDREFFQAIPVQRLQHDMPVFDQVDVVCVDEGQFFPNLATFCEAHARAGRRVVVAGLLSTFERKPFAPMAELLAVAEHTVWLSAICIVCHRNAHFTRRLAEGTQLELIGGEESYVPCCRSCWDTPVDDTILARRKENIKVLRDMRMQ